VFINSFCGGTRKFGKSGFKYAIIFYVEHIKKELPFFAEHFGTHGYNGFSFNLDVVKAIGYYPSDLKSWLFKLLDKYIEDIK